MIIQTGLIQDTFACAHIRLVYKIPYRCAPRLACRVRRASKGILHTNIRPSIKARLSARDDRAFFILPKRPIFETKIRTSDNFINLVN